MSQECLYTAEPIECRGVARARQRHPIGRVWVPAARREIVVRGFLKITRSARVADIQNVGNVDGRRSFGRALLSDRFQRCDLISRVSLSVPSLARRSADVDRT